MHTRYCLREAEATDIESMLPLLAELFALEKDFSFDANKQRIGLQMLLETDTASAIVATVEEQIVGMATGQLLITTAEGGRALLVEDVVVQSEWQGQGIGGSILARLQSWGRERGVRRLQLLADRDNPGALTFYQKRGWITANMVCLRRIITEE